MFSRLKMTGGALSQVLNVLTAFDLNNTGPNESVSARMHRQKLLKRERLIDFFALVIFRQVDHCKKSYEADVYNAIELLKNRTEDDK